MAITTTQAQGLVLALFGASAGGHLTGLAAASNLNTLAGDLSTSAGLILGKDLSSNTAFRDHITANLKLSGDALTAANAWLDGQLNAGAARGDIIATAVTFLSTLTDTTSPFYASAQAFQATVTAAVAWSTGAGATEFGVSALRAQQGNVDVVPGQSFTLTTGTDSFVGTSGDDTVTGTTLTLTAGDVFVDQSTSDNDTANITLSGDLSANATISGVEQVNFVWNSFATGTLDITRISGAESVNISSSKVGFLGSVNVDNARANSVVAGSGMVGTVDVDGVRTGGTVTANNAVTVDVTADTNVTTNTVTVTALNATTVNVTDFATATVTADKATAITVDDNGKSTAVTTLNVDAATAITVTTTNATGTVIINTVGDDATALTMTDATGKEWQFSGEGDVTVTTDVSLSAEIVKNNKTSGLLTVKNTATAALDLEEVDADLIWLTGDRAGADTVAAGAVLKYSAAASDIDITVAGSASTDSVTATVTANDVDSLTATGVETLNIVASATQVTGTDLTFNAIYTNSNTVVLSGTNDVVIDVLTETAATDDDGGTLDASALTGTLTVSATDDDEDLEILGATGINTITLTQDAGDVAVTTQDAADTITSALTTGSLTALMGAGANTLTAAAQTSGTLVVTAGNGIDTISANAVTTGTVNITAGDGANVISVGGSDTVTSGNVTVVSGDGNDTITIGYGAGPSGTTNVTSGAGDDTITISGASTTAAGAKVTINGGDGTDVLLLDDGTDWRAGAITINSDVEVIRLETGDDNLNAYFQASDLSGQTFTIQSSNGTTAVTNTLGFTVSAAATTTTIDLSTLTIDRTVDHAIYSSAITATSASQAVTITGTAVADTITGSSYSDTIVAGNGVDNVTGGDGSDSINLTETTANSAVDNVNLDIDNSGYDSITGFKIAKDTLTLSADTEEGTSGGAADFGTSGVTVVAGTAGGVAFALSDVDEEALDVIELAATLTSRGDLDNATDGTELLKALSSTAYAATGIDFTDTGTDNSSEVYLVAYQDGNAYLYHATGGADDLAGAAEIQLVAVLNGITAGALTASEFLMA